MTFCETTRLLGCVQDVSSGNLEVVHEVVHLLELRQANNLERCLDNAAAEELDGFGAVLAVADVGCPDADHLDNGLEDWGDDLRAGWETDENNGTTYGVSAYV